VLFVSVITHKSHFDRLPDERGTRKPACAFECDTAKYRGRNFVQVGEEEDFLWEMTHKTTATPLWASDKWADGPERKIKYLPYPSAAETIFGFDYDDEPDPDPVS
jgi:hypothetical protein